ncbi:unnamed protein product [Parnassius apollo]|uniref:(apollo) hypothetical protein n=1 Tax=Parnassius apollo TaxID=110799 RepID=A0A8S3X8E6_PARAO|nr:unnamed protein product [Parnassius apollo]
MDKDYDGRIGKRSSGKIINKFLTPSNFKAVIAPQMNPEIKASLSEILIKRDKREIVEQLSDTAKIAADIFYEDSAARKYFALSGATLVLREATKNAKTVSQKFLFGKDCPENTRTAQTIQKTGAQIKAVEKKKTAPKKGNWKSPLQVHPTRSGQNYRAQPYKPRYRPSQPLWRKTQNIGAPPAQTKRNHRH